MTTLEQWHAYIVATGQAHGTADVRVRAIRSMMGHADLTDPLDLNRGHVVAFLARPIAQWTRVAYWQSITAWSQFLREFDLDPTSDLTKGIRRPRSPEPVARPITDDTVARLLSAKLTPRAHAYVRLALYEALRVHEIAKIRGEDLDLDAGWLMVTGKGGVTAPVPLHPAIVKLAQSMPEFGYWFPSTTEAGHVDGKAVSATIINALRLVGSTATAHQLRDTAATRMQRRGKDLRVTQTMLRHRSVRSTQKYTGVADESMHEAVLLLDWDEAA